MELEAAKMLGAGLAVIGVIGSGIGIGSIFASFIQAVGRNPAAQSAVFPMTMLGLRAGGSHRAVRARHRARHSVHLIPAVRHRPGRF